MVTTKLGPIEGVDLGSCTVYKGIPYAKPPVGELRWRAPEPCEPFEGVYAATDFRSKCVQAAVTDPPYGADFYDDPAFDRPQSEDCLYLHIWAPKGAHNCPVAVWYHGGAFLHGWGTEKEFDGVGYCERGVIFVSVEYRCNVFGFLAHPWLTEESGNSGNYGILDEIAALRWVYENIEAFGGDPGNITVFGQSAGAMSVQTLLSSPLCRGMIAKAVMQSGGSYGEGLHRDMTRAELEGWCVRYTESLGVGSLAELRAKSTEELFAAIWPFMGKIMPEAGGLVFIPVIDGEVLTEGYYAAIDDGSFADVPVMVGSTKDDIIPAEGEDKRNSPLYRGSAALARKLSELGRAGAYVYWFAHDLPGDELGAWHSSELFYMMGTLSRCRRPWTDADFALQTKMLDCWTSFMKTGNPNADGEDAWRICTKDDPFVMEFR